MAREIQIVIEYPDGKNKAVIVKSVDEAFRLCRDTGGSNWKPLSYRPWINRVGL